MIRVIAVGAVRQLQRKVVGSDRQLASFVLDCEGTMLRCVAWGQQAELVPDEGALVVIAGRMASRTFTTQDGQERMTTEVTVQDLTILRAQEVMPAEEW